MEDDLLLAVGVFLLVIGVSGLGMYGPFGDRPWLISGRQTILGGVAILLPVVVILRLVAWLATGELAPGHSIGTVLDPISLPTEKLRFETSPLRRFAVRGSSQGWVLTAGERIRSIVAGLAVTAGTLAIASGSLRYWGYPRSSSSIRHVRGGVSLVVLVVLFSVILATMAWLTTGGLTPGDGIGSGRTGVTTSFETGSLQGWSVETGSAAVHRDSLDGHALRIDGTVERSFELGPLETATTHVALDIEGPAKVTITSDGTSIATQTVQGASAWMVPSSSRLTVRIAGRGILLGSARVTPVLHSHDAVERPAGGGQDDW